MPVQAVSSLASSFPNVEVAYQDLLGERYQADARYGSGAIDCIGVVLEIYRRAGLGLPDPRAAGSQIFDFAGMFDEVTDPTSLYDLILLSRDARLHVMVIIRYGEALSAGEKVGVYRQKVSILKRSPNAKFYRLKPSHLPV